MQQVQSDRNEVYREAFDQVGLHKEHLVSPVFVSDRHGSISSMPSVPIMSVEKVADHIETIASAGLSSVIVFGIPKTRDADGTQAAGSRGIVQQAVRAIKSGFGKSVSVTTDVCVCQYNLSGHCGILHGGRIDNDLTLHTLAEIAKSHAEAGAEIVAPSAMMDGQVAAIKSALFDIGHGAKILSYSAKHASSLYTPFRSAAFAKARLKIDKSTYQVSYANPLQAMREIESDICEGADMVMIKPAMAYLDLIRMAKERFGFPLAAQNVSGEYAMIKSAGTHGLIDEEEWKVNTIAAIRRAGADRIISYFARDIAAYL